MPKAIVCRGCGVKVPWRVGACPSCGKRLGRRWIVIGALAAIVAIVGVIKLGFVLKREWNELGPMAEGVNLSPGRQTLSADGRGTNVVGSFTNKNRVAVNVTVRVVGLDFQDNVIASEVVGPFNDILPGATRNFTHRVESTPLKSVYFELVDVHESNDDVRSP